MCCLHFRMMAPWTTVWIGTHEELGLGGEAVWSLLRARFLARTAVSRL